MKTLWIFGDSFSTPYDDKTLSGWSERYIQWKGYVPKYFGDIIGEELGLEVRGFGSGGIDNDTIFERILKQAPKIKKGDYVIIGWSSLQRFRLAAKNGLFKTFIPNYIETTSLLFENISVSTIEEIMVNRDSRAYEYELYTKIKFLNWLFRDTKLIHWTSFWYMSNILGYKDIEKIDIETNDVIKDGHHSERGNQQIAKNFIELFNDDEMRNEINHKMCIPNLI